MGTSKANINIEVNSKQLLFVEEYLLSAPDFNGTQAAIRAGYSKRSAGVQSARMLGYANIKALIKKRKKEIEDRAKQTLDIDRFWVLRKLKDIILKKATKDADKISALKLLGQYFGLWKIKEGDIIQGDVQNNVQVNILAQLPHNYREESKLVGRS